MSDKVRVQIIGAGLSGLSAAIALAKKGIQCNLFSVMPSERAQSVMAEGGINGALNTMGEDDSVDNHFEDTYRVGVYLADVEAVKNLTNAAPDVIRYLESIGVPFNRDDDIVLRNFGGQKKKRTAYSRSSTGKIVMNALIDEARRYEANGLIHRYSHHEFIGLDLCCDDNADTIGSVGGNLSAELCEVSARECQGVYIRDTYQDTVTNYKGVTLLAFGGMNGLFAGLTTGTTINSSDAHARVLSQGIKLSNLEMIQYHPTTISIASKRALVSEAARGEGGRLYISRGGKPWYFMEEKYPEYGNLMPRDVVSREEYFVLRDPSCEGGIYLDMTHLERDVWKNRLPDLREEIIYYLGIDPSKEAIPVEPGIHYFMGGIDVDVDHRASITHVYASGECTSIYHGANRLGGNSMLGAIYGGMRAAETIAGDLGDILGSNIGDEEHRLSDLEDEMKLSREDSGKTLTYSKCSSRIVDEVRDILSNSMGIVRDESGLKSGLDMLSGIEPTNEAERNRVLLAKSIISSALLRRESRGAHYRSDYIALDESQQMMVKAYYDGEDLEVFYEKN